LPPVTPFTVQVTAVFELPVTLARYCEELPRFTLVAPVSMSVTVPPPGGGDVNVVTRLFATEVLATLVAVMVTVDG
jgi:hypothetical protein